MPWFEGSHNETFTVPVSPERAAAHFADLATIARETHDVERFDIEGDVLHFVLKAQDHAGVVKFQADYRCRYVREGNRVSWTPVSGNSKQSGSATFTAVSGGTKVDYIETVEVDMDVPGLMAPMLRQIIGPMIGHEIEEFVKRMAAGLK